MWVRSFLLVCVTLSHTASADVFEPGPEAPTAVTAGASEVNAAVALGKDRASKWDALHDFQMIAQRWPASLHDCYLALAYLRTDSITEAKLVWDRGVTRGTARPGWCTGDLANQLQKALDDNHYFEVVVDVTPRDALVTVQGRLQVRNMTSLWWPCSHCGEADPGTLSVDVEAPGYKSIHIEQPRRAPITRIEARLERKPPSAQEADFEPPPSELAPPTTPTQTTPTPLGNTDDYVLNRHRDMEHVTLFFGAVTGGLTLITGVTAYVKYKYDDEASKNLGVATIVFGSLAVISFGSYAYLRTHQPPVQVQALRGGLVMAYTGTFGGP